MDENYFKAFFHSKIKIKQPFAVITAHNPFGEIIDPEDNDDRHKHFMEYLSDSGLLFEELEVGAKDKSHIEISAAIKCTKSNALKIAQTLEQNDIFWVEKNKTFIINCETGKSELLKKLKEMYISEENDF
jgi:hypothetical protein